MNALFVDPRIEREVIRAAKAIELASALGVPTGPAVLDYEAARAEQAAVRRERGRLMRESGAIRC